VGLKNRRRAKKILVLGGWEKLGGDTGNKLGRAPRKKERERKKRQKGVENS